jgi:hypothetical protein
MALSPRHVFREFENADNTPKNGTLLSAARWGVAGPLNLK